MSIDKDTLKNISKLARISLDDKNVDSLSKNLSSIIKFIENLNELNTDKIKPLTSIIDTSLTSRKDEVNDQEIRDQILKNSPEKNEEFFVVPKVIE
ncbi:MAG TPA: Asp-tRNA(Asn)/Glu-tRNA(Gln) amidotransferase subunit GatC [Candidatus Pelagibacter sp.]|jgi:aspartyl-tRNA(Asn)/glutamyl-tRNA(Gln) amidotransferase subunit C|nr:Asp-tRNA(Asn)/Glu-tRNA(Gln) amidotransferase subunit GatC [Candidatus Pelagibacter sp.]